MGLTKYTNRCPNRNDFSLLKPNSVSPGSIFNLQSVKNPCASVRKESHKISILQSALPLENPLKIVIGRCHYLHRFTFVDYFYFKTLLSCKEEQTKFLVQLSIFNFPISQFYVCSQQEFNLRTTDVRKINPIEI